MKGPQFKVDSMLRVVFLEFEKSEFSILELRDKFESIHGVGNFANSSELRKWIYRRMITLVKRGYLIKKGRKENTPVLYSLSEQFHKKFGHLDVKCNHNSCSDFMTKPSETDSRSILRLKLNQYKVDMLSYAGECKEYQQLATDYPHLKDLIEPMFREARERSSEMIGQLRAINNLMKQSGLPE